jgi:hypothetical protein
MVPVLADKRTADFCAAMIRSAPVGIAFRQISASETGQE